MFFTPQVTTKSSRGANTVSSAGSVLRTLHPYFELVVPFEIPGSVALPVGPKPGKRKTNVIVGVGEVVFVRVGLRVGEGVSEAGIATAVCVDATSAVWAMNVLTSPGAGVGNGVPAVGRHAMTNVNAPSAINSLFLRILIWSPNSFYSTMIAM